MKWLSRRLAQQAHTSDATSEVLIEVEFATFSEP
jgi:hypothetical protein